MKFRIDLDGRHVFRLIPCSKALRICTPLHQNCSTPESSVLAMTIVDRLHRDDNIGSYPEINTSLFPQLIRERLGSLRRRAGTCRVAFEMTSPGRSIAETFDVGFVGWVRHGWRRSRKPAWYPVTLAGTTGWVIDFSPTTSNFFHQPEVTGPRRLRFSNDEGNP
jgi:hypothetical protein